MALSRLHGIAKSVARMGSAMIPGLRYLDSRTAAINPQLPQMEWGGDRVLALNCCPFLWSEDLR